MTASQRVLKNTMYLYIRMGMSILVNIFTTRFILQALGVSDYGLYNVVGGVISMLGFLSASMSVTTQRFLNYAEGKGESQNITKIFSNSIVIHRGLALVTIIILSIAALFFFNGILNIPEGREKAAIIVYICMMFSTVYSITISPYDATLNSHENMFYYSLLGIGDVLLKLIISIFILYIDTDRLLLYAVLMAVESWIFRLATQRYCVRKYKECRNLNLRKNFDLKLFKEMTSFASWNLTNIGSGMISLYGMNVVVNHYFGTNVNAALGIATQLSGVLMAVSLNMIKALTPVLVKKEGANQREKMLDITYTGCKFSYLLFSFVCIPVIFNLNYLLKLWLQKVPDWTAIFCSILIIGTLFEQLIILLYNSIMAEGNIKIYNLVKSISNLFPLFISIILFSIWSFPPYWAILNWCIFKSFFGGFINIYFSKKIIGLNIIEYTKKVILPCSRITIIISFIGWILHYLYPNNIANFTLMVIISIPLYWIFALNSKERIIFRNILNQINC